MDLHIMHSVADSTTVLAGTGIFDTLTEKITKTGDLMRAAAIVAAIYFVMKNAVVSGGSVPRIAISMVAAGLFIWGVFHVTDLGTRTDNEIKATGTLSGQQVPRMGPGSPGPLAVLPGGLSTA